MPDSTTISWLIAHFGIAALALILLDRSHRDAHKKLEEAYAARIADNGVIIDSLQAAVDVLKERLMIAHLKQSHLEGSGQSEPMQ